MLTGVLLALLLVSPSQTAAPRDLNPLELSPAMKLFLDSKIEKGMPPLQRLEALVMAVFQSNELKFSYSPESRTAIETFENRSGNCLSFTLLFIAMARHLNLDAKFREVEVPPMFTKNGDFVNLSQHLNAAVFIGGQAYAIDVFPGVVPIDLGGQIVPDERGIAHFFNNKGVDELANNNIETATVYLRKALDVDPTTVGVWINLGAASSQIGKLKDAERYYRKALEIEPKNLAAMNNLANVCAATGRKKEADLLQAKVKEFREKNPYHHFNLGMQSYQAGKYQEALAHYKRAIKLKSTDHNFYFAVACAYAQIGQNQEIIANLQLAEKYASDPGKKLKYAQKLELLRNMRQHGASPK